MTTINTLKPNAFLIKEVNILIEKRGKIFFNLFKGFKFKFLKNQLNWWKKLKGIENKKLNLCKVGKKIVINQDKMLFKQNEPYFCGLFPSQSTF